MSHVTYHVFTLVPLDSRMHFIAQLPEPSRPSVAMGIVAGGSGHHLRQDSHELEGLAGT